MIRSGKRSVQVAVAMAVAGLCTTPVQALVAFPGAHGFGANATGGRGGDVYHVTTLADDPNHLIPGSLYYGLYEKNVPAGGRTIVFDVGGVLSLGTQTLDIKNINHVTIAGQTAPSPVVIVGNTVQITGSSGKQTSNIILQGITIRKGEADGEDDLSIKGSGNTHDIIVDHVSASWATDEQVSVTQQATNVTVQNSLISEGLNLSSHAYGSLVRPDMNSSVSYVNNLYANNKSRNPRPGTYDNFTVDFDFRNNVIYNWSDRAGYTGGASEGDVEHVNMNYIGNYAIAGPSTPAGQKSTTAFTKDISSGIKDPLDVHVYQNDNRVDSNHDAIRDGVDSGWGMFVVANGTTTFAFDSADKQATPFAYPSTTADAPEIAYAKVLASAGAWAWNRDAVDARIINNVKTNTGAVIDHANAAEWNALLATPTVTRPADWDTDHDGMPNAWEISRGLNPSVADNNGLMSNGYTNLENYLNDLMLVANWNVNGDGDWSGILNWAGMLPNVVDATANFGPVIAAPRTITVSGLVTVGQLNFDSVNGYTLIPAGAGAITMDVLSGTAAISVTSGNHTIAAPVVLADNTSIDIVSAGSSLAFTGPLSATGTVITKSGAGMAQFENVRSAGLVVAQGSVKISAKPAANDPAGTSTMQALSVADDASIDLTNNSLMLDYTGATPIDTIRQMLSTGQITSSLASATNALGYADTGSSIQIKYTPCGDANLDRQVDVTDLGALATNWQTSGVWSGGDFNYDGFVDVSDLGMLATNWQAGVASGSAAAASSNLQAAMASLGLGGVSVPEPVSLAALLLSGLPMLRMRREFAR